MKRSLHDFFGKAAKQGHSDAASASAEKRAHADGASEVSTAEESGMSKEPAPEESGVSKAPAAATANYEAGAVCARAIHPNDIAYLLNRTEIDDEMFVRFAKECWNLQSSKDPMPSCESGGRKRYMTAAALQAHPWLKFSRSRDAFFCLTCVLGKFIRPQLFKRAPGPFVVSGFSKYKNISGTKSNDLLDHESSEVHRAAASYVLLKMTTLEQPDTSVISRINVLDQKERQENRSMLHSVLDILITMVTQNIALRGHRDDGELDAHGNATGNEGNFREIVKLRIRGGDRALDDYLKRAPQNATYLGKNTQNELVSLCAMDVVDQIVLRVKLAGVYGIGFDETTDASGEEQLSACLRFVSPEGRPEERFIGFTSTLHEIYGTDLPYGQEPVVTGVALGQLVARILQERGLDLDDCVSISTDTCKKMTGRLNGAVQELQKYCRNAVYVPCSSHLLNLALGVSSRIPHVQHVIVAIKGVVTFFNDSAKRKFFLKTRNVHLQKLCETRWVARIESVDVFMRELPSVHSALSEIFATWSSSSVTQTALSHLGCLERSTFLFAGTLLRKIGYLFQPSSKALQDPKLTSDDMIRQVEALKQALRNRVTNASFFEEVLAEAAALAKTIGVEMEAPRGARGVDHRDYFENALYKPTLTEIADDLEHRFSKSDLSKSYGLGDVLKIPSGTVPTEDLIEKVMPFCAAKDDTTRAQLRSQLELWSSTRSPSTAITTLLYECNGNLFPLVRRILAALASTPLGIATPERSFSALRRIKTWLRTTMTNERLSSSAIIALNRDLRPCPKRVIDKFAAKARKIKL